MAIPDYLKRQPTQTNPVTPASSMASLLSKGIPTKPLADTPIRLPKKQTTPVFTPNTNKTTTLGVAPQPTQSTTFRPSQIFPSKENAFTNFQNGGRKFLIKSGANALKMSADALDFYTSYVVRNPDKVVKATLLPITGLRAPKMEDTPELAVKKRIKNDWQDFASELLDSGYNPSRRAKKAMDKIILSDYMQPAKEWSEAPLSEKLTKRLPQTLVELGPSVVASIAMYGVNPTFGAASIIGSTAQDVKEEGMKYGLNESEAERLALPTGIAVGLMDRLVPAKIFSGQRTKFAQGMMKRLARTIVESGKRGLEEAGTEALQESIQIAAESTFRDDLGFDEIKTRNALSAVMGLFGGAGANIMTQAAISMREQGFSAGLSIKDVSDQTLKKAAKASPTPEEFVQSPEALKTKKPVNELVQLWVEANVDPNQKAQKIKKEVVSDPSQDKLLEIERQVSLLDPEGQTESEVLTQLEVAEKGNRIFVPRDVDAKAGDPNNEARFIAEKSTFPKFVPDNLRSKELFDSVLNDISNKQIPKKIAGVRLYTTYLNEINSRLGIPQRYTIEDVVSIRDDKAKYAKLNAQMTTRMLKQAEGISRSATPQEVKKAVQSISPQPRAEGAKQLRVRLRALAAGSRSGLKEGRIEQKLIAQSKKEITKEKSDRITELKLLKQRMKDRRKFMRAGIEEGQASVKLSAKYVQKEIREALRESNLSPSDRDKFTDMLKSVQTVEQLQKKMPVIEDRIVQLETRAERGSLINRIRGALTKTKPVKSGKTPKGKFTPELQKVFDFAREAVRMTEEEAQQKVIDNLTQYKSNPPVEIAMQNRILSMRYGGVTTLNQLAQDIDEMIETGKLASNLKKFNTQGDIERTVGMVEDVLTGGDKNYEPEAHKDLKGKVKKWYASVGKSFILSWGGMMEASESYSTAQDKRMRDTFGILDQENKVKQLHEDFINEFNGVITSAYNIQEPSSIKLQFKISKKINQLNKVITIGDFVFADGKTRTLRMTRDEAIKRYMEFQDPTLIDSFEVGNKYTDEIKDSIVGILSKEDKAFAMGQLEMYRAHYDVVNEVYRDLNGIDLPFNEFYSPIRRTGYKGDPLSQFGEFLDEANYMVGVGSGSLNARVNSSLEIAQQGSTKVLARHFAETNYYVAWAERLRFFNSVFGDGNVRSIYKDRFGEQFLHQIDRQLKQLASKGKAVGERYVALDWLRKKYSVGSLMIKPAIFVKQLTGVFAYLEEVSSKDFLAGIADFMKNPIQNARILNEESTFIRNRIDYKERDITDALNSDVYKAWSAQNNLINTLMLNVSYGDKLPVLLGSWAMRKKLIEQGKLSMKQIIDVYSNFGQETQQSSDTGRMSSVQTGGSFAQLFTMFISAPRAMLQKEVNAIRSIVRQGGTSPQNLKRVARVIVLYHFVLPLIFQMVANAFRTDDDAEKDYKRAAIMGPINGLFIFGSMIESVVRAALGQKVWPQQIPVVTVVEDVTKMIKSLNLADIEPVDYEELVKGIAGTTQALGLPTEWGLGIYNAGRNIVEGDVKEGILNASGWSDFALGKGKPKETIAEKKKKEGDFYKKQIADGLMSEQAAREALSKKVKAMNKSAKKDLKDNMSLYSKEEFAKEIKELIKVKAITEQEGKSILKEKIQKDKTQEADTEARDKKIEEAKERGVYLLSEDDNILDVIERGAKAFRVDKKTAFKAMFSSEKIDLVNDKRVGLLRMGEEQAAAYKEEFGINAEDYRLEHIVPRAIGGGNGKNNLRVLTKSEWSQFTKADTKVINAVDKGTITPAQGRDLIEKYKNGEMTFEELELALGS